MELHHCCEIVAVLAAEVLEELATLAQERQSLGRLVDGLAACAKVAGEVVELREEVPKPSGLLREGRPTVDRGQRSGGRVAALPRRR